MKIAINATYNPSGGTLTQLINMIHYFSKMDDIEIIIFIKKQNLNLLKNIENKNIEIIISKFAGVSRPARVLWEQTILPFLLIIYRIDVLFCPGNIAPLFSSVKTVVWIHTIGPFVPEFYKHFSLYIQLELHINKLLMSKSAYRSDAVIFESNLTRKLFIDRYGIHREKSYVINIGKDAFYYPVDSNYDNNLNNKYKSFSPYTLCVSHLYPYKNIVAMLYAFREALNATDGADLKLLIAGSNNNRYYNKEILKTIDDLSLNKFVVLLGSVSKKDLRHLYSECKFIIFPSPYENFPYTLVEAMSCGAAITCSNTTAMPEACKDAALYFNPYDIEEMGKKISLMISDKNLRNTLSQKSISRANELPDFEQVTIKTIDIMKSLIK